MAFQKAVMSKAMAFVHNAVMGLYCQKKPKCLTVVDMGCSSGPNSLLAISQIIDSIVSVCQSLGHPTPGNDFNTLFKTVPSFIDTKKKETGDACFISGLPGSFHGRLFPTGTLDFVHSSYSLHFLSRVLSGIENNREHIYIVKPSPPNVVEAYFQQYRRDFTSFLDSRSHEVVQGGRMVITIIGRRSSDHSSKECCDLLELLAKSLRDMVSEEVRTIIQEQGSFRLDLLEIFDVNWNYGNDGAITRGKYVSNTMRAVTESMLFSHFGDKIINKVFDNYAKHVEEYLMAEEGKVFNLVMSMTKIV